MTTNSPEICNDCPNMVGNTCQLIDQLNIYRDQRFTSFGTLALLTTDSGLSPQRDQENMTEIAKNGVIKLAENAGERVLDCTARILLDTDPYIAGKLTDVYTKAEDRKKNIIAMEARFQG